MISNFCCNTNSKNEARVLIELLFLDLSVVTEDKNVFFSWIPKTWNDAFLGRFFGGCIQKYFVKKIIFLN